MTIALISYEYPPDTADGGIATYVYQAAKMLKDRGNIVEVFAGSRSRDETDNENGVLVHRTRVSKRMDFSHAIVDKFVKRHKVVKFDVIEGPDFLAEARVVVQACPQIPYVVKLHTPSVVVYKYDHIPLTSTFKMMLGKARRGINPFGDFERDNARRADVIASPSISIANMLIKLWDLNPSKIIYFPNPFIISKSLLDIPTQIVTNRITYLGRLEQRKGVIELAQAVRFVLNEHPFVKFRFVGANRSSPDPKLTMREYLLNILQENLDQVEFIDQVPSDKVPSILAETDICVFPSRFDSFGLVCLEAMAAGRGVIGSSNGGMAEIINSSDVGLLVPPNSPLQIAQAINELLASPKRRFKIGEAARKRVLDTYGIKSVGEAQEQCYQEAIRRRRLSKV